MRTVKDTILLLNIANIFLVISFVITTILLWVCVHQRNEARRDANRFFDDTIELREYKDANIKLDSLKSAKIDQEWNALIEALIIVESQGVEMATGDNGRAIGVLQIHPDVIDDVRIAGYDYTLKDRYDREKSIEIWNAWQSIYNPEKDIWKAIKRHNPRISYLSCERIIAIMNSMKDDN